LVDPSPGCETTVKPVRDAFMLGCHGEREYWIFDNDAWPCPPGPMSRRRTLFAFRGNRLRPDYGILDP
jgi:hypothetical protein